MDGSSRDELAPYERPGGKGKRLFCPSEQEIPEACRVEVGPDGGGEAALRVLLGRCFLCDSAAEQGHHSVRMSI